MNERFSFIDSFPGNFLWSNATLIMKGLAPYGVIAVEEIERICEKLSTRQGDADAWRDEWHGMAAKLEQKAEEAARAGHKHTAANNYLRAGNYYYNAERFILPGAEKKAMGKNAYHCYHTGIRLRHPHVQFVEVPYEQVSLPGLFVPAAGGAPRSPAVVIVNGMDNAKEMSVFFAALEFAKRGIGALALDGPGQGESLRMRDIRSRHDYEAAGSAAYDFLAARRDTDPQRVAIMGYSFGGYYASRIAAFEKRYAAGIALSALHWDLAAWQTRIKEKTLSDPKGSTQSNFQFRWVVGAETLDDAIEIARKFDLKDVAKQITCPFLVTHGEVDRTVPVENARKLFEAIGSDKKQLKIFSVEEGGGEHAHVDNRQVGIDYASDWLADTLGVAQP